MLTQEPSSLKGSSISNAYFFIQGIGTLLPYSAIISTLDFFDVRYPTANVAFTFPLANFASNIILTFSMVYVKKNTSLSFRIPICSFITVLLLLGMPIVGLLLPNSILGLWILYLFLFLIGAFNTITNATVVGIAGHFPMGCMGSNTTGTSVSGLMSNILRAICLAIFPYGVSTASTRTEILLYYGTSTIFLLFCIFLYYKFIDTEFAVAYLPQESHLVVVHPRDAADYDVLEEGITAPDIDNTGWGKAKDNFKELYRVLKQLKLLSLVMIICHIQTLMLSPGVMLERNLNFLNPAWNIVVQLAVFNFFDVLGKMLTFIRWAYSEALVTIVTALRMVFYYTFIVQALGLDYNVVGEDWFTFLNVGLFGLTNGYITSAVFILSPSKVEGHDKEIAGFLALLNLLLGITVGSIGALPLRYLHDY